MFAATTTDALILSDTTTLKKSPSSIPSCLDLIASPTASSWSPDTSFLYISSLHIIHRYEPTSNSLKDVYAHPHPISHLVCKDKDTVVFASEDKIHILECEPNPRISQTFDSHKTPLTSLSLSTDNSLLSTTSEGALHVYNLTLGSYTIMRGLPNQNITTATFHTHSRTRLLVAAGKQLMVYDTTRPSGPIKTITMNDSGDITYVACSPFSKTLVAIATPTGFVGLIDLDKEKALFRTLNLKAHLTSLGFSPEGAAIYLGTKTGKLLVLDLRSLDKPTKGITLGDNGSRVATISVQRKVKVAEAPIKTPIGTTTKKTSEVQPMPRRTTVTQTSKPISKPVPSPARPRAGASSISKDASTTPKRSSATKVLSPIRDPLGNSASGGNIASQFDDRDDRRRAKTTTTPQKMAPKSSPSRPRPNATENRPSTKVDIENPRRAWTLPTSTSASALSNRKISSGSITASASAGDRLGARNTGLSPVRRLRTASSASRVPSEAISAVSSKSATTTTTTTTGTLTSSLRPSSSASSLTSHFTGEGSASPTLSSKRSVCPRSDLSRTPTPELPDINMDPVTPVPANKQKKKDMGVLGLGTPEVNRWIQAGKENPKDKKSRDAKGKGKVVGFQDAGDEVKLRPLDEDDEDAQIIKEKERSLSMQISPRRPLPGVSVGGSGSSESWTTAPPNPNLLSGSTSSGSGGPGSAAQELLKTIVQDVMYDFQRETKAEMMGLHLDLLKMGRGWKNELRTLMDEYVGDLRELREENQRLRLENERLRGGY